MYRRLMKRLLIPMLLLSGCQTAYIEAAQYYDLSRHTVETDRLPFVIRAGIDHNRYLSTECMHLSSIRGGSPMHIHDEDVIELACGFKIRLEVGR